MTDNFAFIHGQYAVWLNTLGFSKSTIRRCSSCARDFLLWLESQNIIHIAQLKTAHIKTFYNYLQTRENKKYGGTLSNSRLNDYYMAIDKLMEFLHQMGADDAPSPPNCRITIDQNERIRKIEPFTVEEIKTLQAQIDGLYPNSNYNCRTAKREQLKLVFALFYGCGLRLSEGIKLTAKDIDFNRRTIFVRQGKNYKDRIVPMSESVYKVVQNYLYNFRNQIKCGHNMLFINHHVVLLKALYHLHSQCPDENIRNKRLYFHILRHSIATHLLQNGMTVENIARFLGHNSLTSTQIYTHIANR